MIKEYIDTLRDWTIADNPDPKGLGFAEELRDILLRAKDFKLFIQQWPYPEDAQGKQLQFSDYMKQMLGDKYVVNGELYRSFYSKIFRKDGNITPELISFAIFKQCDFTKF